MNRMIVRNKSNNYYYELLHVLEFTSARKRMSVILKDFEGNIILYCKGADSIIFKRMQKNQ